MLNCCDCEPAAGLELKGSENQDDDRGEDGSPDGGDLGLIFGSGKGRILLLGFGGGGDDPQRKLRGLRKKGQAFV